MLQYHLINDKLQQILCEIYLDNIGIFTCKIVLYLSWIVSRLSNLFAIVFIEKPSPSPPPPPLPPRNPLLCDFYLSIENVEARWNGVSPGINFRCSIVSYSR